MPVVPRGWCTRLIETRLFGSGTCARPDLPALSGSTSGRAWYVRDSYKWNASRTITFLFWAGPFHQIFEKRPNLVFDGRRGDRLRFYDCLPRQTLSENGKGRHKQCRCAGMRFAKLGQRKTSGPTRLGMRRPFLRKETGERKSYAIDRPFFIILFEAGQIENEMQK